MAGYSKCDQATDLRQQLEVASKLESNLVHWGRKLFFCLLVCFCFFVFSFSMLEKLNVFPPLTNLITSVSLMLKWMGLYLKKNEEKPLFKILGHSFSFKLGWGFYIASITKFVFKKI